VGWAIFRRASQGIIWTRERKGEITSLEGKKRNGRRLPDRDQGRGAARVGANHKRKKEGLGGVHSGDTWVTRYTRWKKEESKPTGKREEGKRSKRGASGERGTVLYKQRSCVHGLGRWRKIFSGNKQAPEAGYKTSVRRKEYAQGLLTLRPRRGKSKRNFQPKRTRGSQRVKAGHKRHWIKKRANARDEKKQQRERNKERDSVSSKSFYQTIHFIEDRKMKKEEADRAKGKWRGTLNSAKGGRKTS